MYAVIATGGKQARVTEGSRLDVERLGVDVGDEVTFTPVLLVDGDAVTAAPGDLEGATVTARVVGEAKGPKIRGFTYRPKARTRRRWGHRQHYATIEVTSISARTSAGSRADGRDDQTSTAPSAAVPQSSTRESPEPSVQPSRS